MPPPPATGYLNSHPQLSACRLPHTSVMRVSILHPHNIPSLKYVRYRLSPFRRYGWCSVTTLIRMVTLTFRPLNRVTTYPYNGLPSVNLQLTAPFRSRFRIRHVTDRQTDRQQPSMHYAPPYRGGAKQS